MITGLVAITPAAGYVNGWGAIALGVIASTIVYMAMNYLSALRPFRNVDDTLGAISHARLAGLAGGLLTGIFADPGMIVYYAAKGPSSGYNGLLYTGNFTVAQMAVPRRSVGDRLVGDSHIHPAEAGRLVIPLRMSQEDMEIGDTAVHGHEVYPSDIPSLGFPNGVPGYAGTGEPATV